MQITVKGKDNLGFSPKFGEIVKGQEYIIEAEDFADQLFDKSYTSDPSNPSDTPNKKAAKGGL